MKSVYIILSDMKTRPSRLIKLVTRAQFSHVSIALVPSSEKLYSFGRRKINNFLVGGFINEDTKKHVMGLFPHSPCSVYVINVSDDSYEKMELMISECNRQYKDYKYSFLGAFTSYIGIKKRLKYHFTCSQFVAMMLNISGAVRLPKHPSLMKPMDFLTIPDMKLIYQGTLYELDLARIKMNR